MKKQTAVEWLFLMLNNPNRNQDFANKLLQKAKEMELEQISQAYVFGSAYGIDVKNGLSPNNYYEQTYESNT